MIVNIFEANNIIKDQVSKYYDLVQYEEDFSNTDEFFKIFSVKLTNNETLATIR